MEKQFYMCLLLLVAAWQMTWADCSLSLAPVSMNAGGKAVLGINLSNTEEVTAFQFDLRLPTGITIGTTINDDEETVLDIVLTERKKSSHQVTFSQQDDGRYTIAVLSGKNQSLKDIGDILFAHSTSPSLLNRCLPVNDRSTGYTKPGI